MAAIKIDRKPFSALASELKNADGVMIRSQFRAINKVAEKAMTRFRREIVSRVNLTNDYVRERMDLRKASASKLEAVIAARVRPTRLATYGAKQVTRTAKKAKGDPSRGIPAGKKAAGVSVLVKRANGRKVMPGAFLLPLRAGKVAGGNGMGVFMRVGKVIEHDYGFSVDQMLRYVSADLNNTVQEDLDAEIIKQTDYEIRKALKL